MGVPTLEERMDDVRAVMDAAGSKRAALSGGLRAADERCFAATTRSHRALARYGGALCDLVPIA